MLSVSHAATLSYAMGSYAAVRPHRLSDVPIQMNRRPRWTSSRLRSLTASRSRASYVQQLRAMRLLVRRGMMLVALAQRRGEEYLWPLPRVCVQCLESIGWRVSLHCRDRKSVV